MFKKTLKSGFLNGRYNKNEEYAVLEANQSYLTTLLNLPMKTKFTLEHLFLYHYNEMNLSDSLAMEHLIEIDDAFRAESAKIVEMMQLLDTENTKPSTSSIQLILDYDKTSSGEMAY